MVITAVAETERAGRDWRCVRCNTLLARVRIVALTGAIQIKCRSCNALNSLEISPLPLDKPAVRT